jgi:mitochondrial fission protein ELM1
MRAARPLRVWVLSDGQPGHYNLSRGIVAALALRHRVEESWVDVRLRAGLARNLMRHLLNQRSSPPPVGWLRLFHIRFTLPETPCDVIVSAGGRTSFANAWLAGHLRVPNIFAGSLRRLSPQLFDVVLTLEPVTPPAANNLVVDLPPSAIDAAQVSRAGQALREELNLAGQGIWTLMTGGDGAGYRYCESDWRQLAQMLNRLASGHGIRWLLVGSRRTGTVAEKLLGEQVEARHVAASHWYRQGHAGGIDAWLGAADRIFVTEDSMTMLTEALYSGRPVTSLRPLSVDATPRYTNMIERFAKAGWIRRYAIADLAAGRETLDSVPHNGMPPADQLSRLSRKLYEHLPL